jgi:hypothetical protein
LKLNNDATRPGKDAAIFEKGLDVLMILWKLVNDRAFHPEVTDLIGKKGGQSDNGQHGG